MGKRIPQRMCVGCRDMKEKPRMIRVRLTEQRNLSVDESGKADGRGAYVCRDLACIETAVRKKGFQRSFHCSFSKEEMQQIQEELIHILEK